MLLAAIVNKARYEEICLDGTRYFYYVLKISETIETKFC